MDVYLDRQGQRMGPYSVDEINKFLGTGQVLITDMAWYGGQDDWVPLDKVPGVQNVSPPPSTHPLWNSPSGAPPAPAASASSKTEKKSGGLLKGCLIAVGVVVVMAIVGGKKVADEEAAEVKRTEAAPVSNLTWEEIDKIYNLKSDHTELQKKELWKKYKGKKIKWSGNVSSINETFGSLSLQVKINPDTLISDVLVTLKENERKSAIMLKEGDTVTFVGILDDWGTIMPITLNHGEIVE